MNIKIANRLLELRKMNNLSQEELAEKLGISRQAVSKWERAEASPDTDNLIALARLYKVSLDEMLMINEATEAEERESSKESAETEEEGSGRCACESEPYSGQECRLEGLDRIKISVISKDVRISQTDGNKLSVEEYGGEKDDTVFVSVQNNTLHIQEKRRQNNSFLFFRNLQSTAVEIFVPKDFCGELEVETASGDIELNGGWELTELRMKTTSGDMSVGTVRAEKLQLDVVSGDIQFAGGGGRSFIKTISGDIEAACLGGDIFVETGSGDVEMTVSKVTGQVNVKSTSGDADIKIATDISCVLFAEAVSGDVACNLRKAQILRQNEKYVESIIGDSTQTDRLPRVVVQTISGDIDIIG